MHYQKELNAIIKTNRFRKREVHNNCLLDFASNDYLGLGSKKKLFKKAYKLLNKEDCFAPKSSILVNGYHKIHKMFEKKLSYENGFEDALVVGSGFLANISLIEGLVRKRDVLFMDKNYHASGILASKLINNVVLFDHNNLEDLEENIKKCISNRIIIAIEGVYSMTGNIAPKEINNIAIKYDAILIVDEAHSSGVIGDNLLGWYDYYNIKIMPNHIKMGTLGKAYGSYGAYILASKHIISFLENRAKAVIYTTAPSLFDIALGYVSFLNIIKNKSRLRNKILKRQQIASNITQKEINSLILKIEINDDKKAIKIQNKLKLDGFIVGAIRQPTVEKAILRVILKLDMKIKNLTTLLNKIKKYQQKDL